MNDEPEPQGLVQEIRGLRGEVKEAGGKLDAHRAAYEDDKAIQHDVIEAMERRVEASKRKARRATFAGVAGTAAACIAIAVAVFAVSGVAKINDERAARTKTSCESAADNAVKDNRQDASTVESIESTVGFVTGLVEGSTDPETLAQVDAYVTQQEAIAAEINSDRERVRDCSDAGIRLFFDSNGRDGYLP